MSCHRWSPRPSVANFLAIDGHPGPSMAAMDGPPLPQMVPSQKSSRLIHDGLPCLPSILQSSVSCIHVSVRWL